MREGREGQRDCKEGVTGNGICRPLQLRPLLSRNNKDPPRSHTLDNTYTPHHDNCTQCILLRILTTLLQQCLDSFSSIVFAVVSPILDFTHLRCSALTTVSLLRLGNILDNL